MMLKDMITEFVYECEIRNYTQKTIRGYKNNILHLANFLEREFKAKQLEEVTLPMLKSFLKYQQSKKCKGSYINGLIKSFRAFFKYLMQEKYIKENFVLDLKFLIEDKPMIYTFSKKEIKNMLSVYNGRDYLSIRNHTIIAILFDIGIRNYELCCLRNIDIKEEYISIFGKGRKERIVPISNYLKKVLFQYERVKKSYFEDKNVNTTHYLLSRTGKQLTNSALEKIVKFAGIQCQITDKIRCSPHTCRHTFAQQQLHNGLDLYSLMRLMGHTNISITQRYLDSMQDNTILEKGMRTSPLMNL